LFRKIKVDNMWFAPKKIKGMGLAWQGQARGFFKS
jgi:hypothetical protein